jgi:uncharacterized membrane protein YgcG
VEEMSQRVFGNKKPDIESTSCSSATDVGIEATSCSSAPPEVEVGAVPAAKVTTSTGGSADIEAGAGAPKSTTFSEPPRAAPQRKPSLTRMSTMSSQSMKLARQSTVKALKKNPKKSACGTFTIIGVVLGVVLGTSLAVGLAVSRNFTYQGDARSAQVAGAAMGQAGKQSLIPVCAAHTLAAPRQRAHPACPLPPSRSLPLPCQTRSPLLTSALASPPSFPPRSPPQAQEAAEEVSRRLRRRLETETEYTGTLGRCPRDSQVIVEHEATPISTYDGTSIFSTADTINCMMQLTKPGTFENINRGAYTAIVNENSCTVSQAGQQGSGSGGQSGGVGGGGSEGGSSSSGSTISLKTFGINSTQPTAVRVLSPSPPLVPCPPPIEPISTLSLSLFSLSDARTHTCHPVRLSLDTPIRTTRASPSLSRW